MIFSNSKIYAITIQSSKFHGFTNRKVPFNQQKLPNIKNENQYENFLEYEFMLTNNASFPINSQSLPLKVRRIRDNEKATEITLNINEQRPSLNEKSKLNSTTSKPVPAFVTIYAIYSSINTTSLTETYFPNNFEYRKTDEIELSYNYISAIDAYAFRHLQFFEGRLILTYNHIKYVSAYAFAHLYSLKNLSLANNYIQNLSSIHFQDLHQLYELDLSNNQLNELNENVFHNLYNLTILRLNNNPLKFIHSNAFKNLTYLKEINLQGVPLMQLINPQYSHWIWNLASSHANYFLNKK